ncbi:MAG: GDSL-type esterase/lipase family protein [Dysgonamonadaceae bacterium]|jgi:hypothetical protein|nr:GDSL-type esterase/lipase family protein [Dysgonamonadaceae bacterium]
MKKQISFLFTGLLLATAGLFAQTPTQKFYIDFGQDNPGAGRRITEVDANGNYWNNLIAPNGSPSTLNPTSITLKNSSNTSTVYELELAASIQSNGGTNGGLSSPDPALLGDLAVSTATEDYFFLGESKGLLRFKNLDTQKAYRFYIYGCRAATGDQRGVVYSLTGKNGSHGKQLNTGTGIGANDYDGNNNNVWQSTPVVPSGAGEIMLELGRLFNSQMAYISALKMEELSEYALPAAEKQFYIDFGKNNNGLDGAPTQSPDENGHYWNNVYSNGDGWTIGASDGTGALLLIASDNTATEYGMAVASEIRFNGVRNGALGGSDSSNEPTAALLGDLAIKTATYDYLFIENSSQTCVLHFTNLNRQKQYRFNVFGSRKEDSAAGRVGRIEIAGSNSITGIHQMGGNGIGANGENYNNKNIFVSDLIIPDATGKITLTLNTWLAYSHINCIKLEELAGADLPVATGISLSGGNAVTGCGRSIQLTATALPEGALLPAITWSVDDESIARITENGKLYAKANGTVIVTATPSAEALQPAAKEIVISGQDIDDYSFTVMGSSVPSGTGADAGKGYAHLWAKYLTENAENNWTTNNISIGGNTTTHVTNRWDSDLLPSCSRYVYYGLSLGNEGIHESGQAAYNSWRDNMLALIERARAHNKIPLMGNNYPRGDFNVTDYNFVKQLNLLVHEWDVPSVNLLGSIDNGAGQWASGYMADNAHPNTAGHAEMFYAIAPSLLDALAAEKPQPIRNQSVSLILTKEATAQSITFTPENVLHSFTLTFGFKTTDTGTLASFVTQEGNKAFLKINEQGKLAYETYSTTAQKTSTGIVNDGQWHNASLTYYYAWGKTILYLDGAQVNLTPLNEKHIPTSFCINDLYNAPQSVAYREVFLHRAGMSKEEIQALHQGKMLKSSLEIYAPLDATASDRLYNAAQSLNTLTLEERQITAIDKPLAGISPNDKSVYSLTGQLVARFPVSDNSFLSALPKGVYILKQTDGRHTSYEKIVLSINN